MYGGYEFMEYVHTDLTYTNDTRGDTYIDGWTGYIYDFVYQKGERQK